MRRGARSTLGAGAALLAGCIAAASPGGPSAAPPAGASPAGASPAGASPSAPEPAVMRWSVGPARVECTGVARAWCLQVRRTPGGPWTRHFGGIEGFEFRPGVETDVDVRQADVPRPPADGASRRTVLVAEVARRPVPVGPMPRALAGSAWRLASMPGAGSVGNARAMPTLRFDDANGASGDAGVNRWSTRVEAGEGWLRIASPRVTRMAGPPEAMAFEAAFLARLREAGVWHVAGDRLWLVDAGGRELAVFERDPAGR